MKIGIISDSHDQINAIQKTIALFSHEKVKRVYHLGDFCSPFSVRLFSALSCQVKCVFGNNDADIYKMLTYRPKNVSFHDRLLVDTIGGKKIVAVHGDPYDNVQALWKSKSYDIVLYGHDHQALLKQSGSRWLMNPGNLIGPFGSYKWTPPSVVVYDSRINDAQLFTL